MINKKLILTIFLILIFLSISCVQASEIEEIDDASNIDDSIQVIESVEQTNSIKAPYMASGIVIPTYISVTNNNTDFKDNQNNSLNISLIDINGVGLANKEIIIVINESIISTKMTDSNGNAYLNLDNLPYGEYSITYSYGGEVNYTSCSNTTIITISKYIPQTIVTFIKAQGLTIKEGNADTFVVTLTDINGTPLPDQKIIVEIDGENNTWYTNNNGQVNILMYGSPTDVNKTFPVNLYYEGKDQYFPSNGSSAISIVDANAILTTITANDMNLTVTDVEDFVITLKDENGNTLSYEKVLVTFNGETGTWYTNNVGEVRVLLYELKTGIYTITYTFEGEGNYSQSKGSNIITVTNPNSTETIISGKDMVLSMGDVETFTITLTTVDGLPLANQTVNINFLTNLTKKTDENGQVSITLYELSNGTYNIAYSFEGKGIYLESSGSNTITVNSETPEIINTTISGSDITMNINETRNFTVTLRTTNRQVLADQTVYFVFRNIATKQVTNEKGQAVMTFSDLAEGTYTIEYYFNGTNRYGKSNNSNTIKVHNGTIPPEPTNKTPTQFFSSDITGFEGDVISFITILTDEEGFLLSNKTVTFTFNKSKVNATTDTSGQAVLNLNGLKEGVYTVDFVFAGDETYAKSNGTNTITVKSGSPEGNITTFIISENLVKAYGSDTPYTGTLYDINGNTVAGQHINIKVTRLSSGASKVYDVVSNYLGQFVLPINLAAGSYAAEVNFNGITMKNITYLPSSSTNTITVTENRTETLLTAVKFVEEYGANKTFTGTLVDVDDNALSGHTVSVTLTRLSSGASKTYNTIVNYRGEYNIDINLAVGEYVAECSYAGSSIYAPSDASNTLTVYA